MSKPRRRHLLAPFFLVGLAALGWTVWWFVAANRIEQGFDAEAKSLRDQGFDITWSQRKLGGYPFRFFLEMKDLRLAEPGGWAIAAPRFEAETTAYLPKVIGMIAPDGVTLTRPGGRTWRVNGRVLRASISGYRKVPPRISIEGVELKIAAEDGGPVPLHAMRHFQANVLPDLEADSAQLRLLIDRAELQTGSPLAAAALGETLSFGVAAKASAASQMRGASWPELVQNWAAKGGVLAVHDGKMDGRYPIYMGPTGTLTADPAGRAAGELTFSMNRGRDGMSALGALGVIPQETAGVASLAAGVAQSGLAPAEGNVLRVTLDFRDGLTYLGPLPIGPAPRLY